MANPEHADRDVRARYDVRVGPRTITEVYAEPAGVAETQELAWEQSLLRGVAKERKSVQRYQTFEFFPPSWLLGALAGAVGGVALVWLLARW